MIFGCASNAIGKADIDYHATEWLKTVGHDQSGSSEENIGGQLVPVDPVEVSLLLTVMERRKRQILVCGECPESLAR
jgi:hypothetical protein